MRKRVLYFSGLVLIASLVVFSLATRAFERQYFSHVVVRDLLVHDVECVEVRFARTRIVDCNDSGMTTRYYSGIPYPEGDIRIRLGKDMRWGEFYHLTFAEATFPRECEVSVIENLQISKKCRSIGIFERFFASESVPLDGSSEEAA